jgi:hypothetical protein
MLGNAIWVTDGTNDNTMVYLELASNSTNEYLFKWNDRFFFTGSLDINIGTELYELIIKNTGISETKLKTFNTYPNPVKAGNSVTISDTECIFEIYNTLGKLVLQGNSTDGQCHLPDHIGKGLFTIFVRTETAFTNTKLIIQ